MKFMKFAFAIVALVIVLALVGCNYAWTPEKTERITDAVRIEEDDVPNTKTDKATDKENFNDSEDDDNNIGNNDVNNDVNNDDNNNGNEDSDIYISASLEKLGTFEGWSCGSIGSTYIVRVNDNYVITNIEKNKTTETVYAVADTVGNFFAVNEKTAKDINDIDGINSTGVLNIDLEQTVPCEYALFKAISNTGYAVAYKVVAVTENEDEALLYIANEMFEIEPDEDDTLYTGEWCVIELATGRKVQGLTGVEPADFYMQGDVITVRTYSGEDIEISINGNIIPEHAKLLENGCYAIEDEKVVYTADGVKLFDYGKFGKYANIWSTDGECFIVGVMNESYSTDYTILDKTGTPISVAFDKYIQVLHDKIVFNDKGVYLFDGTEIVAGAPYGVHAQDSYYLIEFENRAIIMDSEYNTVMDVTSDSLYIDNYDLAVGIEDENYKVKYYSVPQKDFVYEGTSVAPWLLQVEIEEGEYAIVNTLTDEVLITSRGMMAVSTDDEGNVYFIVPGDEERICYRLNA